MIFIINIVSIIIAIVLFGILVFIHELGHFIAAIKCGITVKEFSIGMGPAILKHERNGILYSIRALPIGGFCDMEGENDDGNNEGSFNSKPIWQRMIVVLAGVAMNLLLGFVLMIMIISSQEKMASTTIDKFLKEDATSKTTGLMENDRFASIDGYKILVDNDIIFAISTNKGPYDIEVYRNNSKVMLKNVEFETKDNEILIDFRVKPIEKNPITILDQALKKTMSDIKVVWYSLFGMISGKLNMSDMSGPVGIVSIVGSAVNEGLKENIYQGARNVISLMIILTINLGVLNLLPVPALDGGRFIFLIIEAIRKKPINRKCEMIINTIGFALFLLLMVFITFSDIMKLFNK